MLYSIPTTKFEFDTLGSFVFELCCGETNRQTNKETNRLLRTYSHRST